MNIEQKLWTERFRPKTINEYVFVNDEQKHQVQAWIAEGIFPNLLLSGEPGTGKTTLAKILIHEVGIHDYDVLEINASRENSVDYVRDNIESFVQTLPFGTFKVVLLDEADYLSPNAQSVLRGMMETYSQTARFILTCNYEYKIIPALRESRCYKMQITKTDRTEFTARAATILMTEGIDFDLEVLDNFVVSTYPDLRKCLNQLQVHSTTGKLLPGNNIIHSEDNELAKIAIMFKEGQIGEARLKLMTYLSFNPGKLHDIYKWMYKNLDLWGTTNDQKDVAIITIRNGLANLSLVGIPEISLAATLAELTRG